MTCCETEFFLFVTKMSNFRLQGMKIFLNYDKKKFKVQNTCPKYWDLEKIIQLDPKRSVFSFALFIRIILSNNIFQLPTHMVIAICSLVQTIIYSMGKKIQ